jgi:carbon monoxide dehydrogenase subunit G
MELTNDFRVAVSPDDAWAVLTDVERIAPCMPGAQLQEIEGDEYRGIVKVKVGPITAQYKGKATFVEKDEASRRAVLRAEGRDTRGQGNANATITATLEPDGDGTRVSVVTDLTVTGKVAQFGRGVMADVSAKLLTQFVECLETTVLVDPQEQRDQAVGVVEGSAPAAEPPATAPSVTPEAVAPASVPSAPGVRTIDSPAPKPVDLLESAGAPVAKRVAPILALVALGWLVRVLVKRRHR